MEMDHYQYLLKLISLKMKKNEPNIQDNKQKHLFHAENDILKDENNKKL